MDIYFMLWVIIQYYIYFVVQVVWLLVIGGPFSWLSYLFDMPHPFAFLSTSLLSGTTVFSKFILYFPCHGPGISHWDMNLKHK